MKLFILIKSTVLHSLLFIGFCINAQTTFYDSPGIYTYTVLPGVDSLTITAVGASGGNQTAGNQNKGGRGAIINGSFPVVGGQVIKVLVGGQPASVQNCAGGGGGSFVWNDGDGSLMIAAGGGGGASLGSGSLFIGGDASLTESGNPGKHPNDNNGGTHGHGGAAPADGFVFYAAAGAGWFSNGVSGGATNCTISTGGVRPLEGGAGGQYGGQANLNGNGGFGGGGGGQGNCNASGGGGGGGYSGGGGGSSRNGFNAGGGGGSFNAGSYPSESINQTYGHGSVTIYASSTITPSAENILYVNQSSVGGNGSSWTNALPELADALKWAREQHGIDNNWLQSDSLQIYVAKGTYLPLYNAEDNNYDQNGNRDNSFVLVKNVQIYGGFDPANGIEDLNDTRILPSFGGAGGGQGTILSGDIGTSNDNTDNTHHVVISAGDIGNALLDGFTLTGGNANGGGTIPVNGENIWRLNGGGMYNSFSSPVLTNVEISNNTADSNGGGMANHNVSSPLLTNVKISNNTASNNGGGVYNFSGNGVFTNVTIAGNSPNAIYAYGWTFWKNTIVYGGIDGTNYTAEYSLIQDNNDTANGNLDVTGLIETDIFADPAGGDYTLQANSPAINAGSNQLWIDAMGPLSGAEVDLAGNPRVYDFANGGVIDIGTYEVQNNAPVAQCQDITVFLGENGTVSISPEDIDNGSSDAEGTVTLSLDSTTFDCSHLGDNTVTLTVEDEAGAIATCETTVTVVDNLPPIPDVTNLPIIEMECEVLASDIPIPMAMDNCAGTVTATTNDPLSYTAQGTYTITWEYDDGNGNTTTQEQTIIVNDVTAPIPDMANLPDIEMECEVLPSDIPIPTATDNCAGTVTATTNDPLSYTAQGTYVITWEYDDGNGNTTTQEQIIIVNDVTAPIPDMANLPDIEMECEVLPSDIPMPTAMDNCAGTITATTNDPLSYTAQGTYTITWEYTDGNGNITTQDQTVIVAPSVLEQVTFDDVTVTYDGMVHTISVGSLPQGVSVAYSTSPATGTPNGAENAGIYTITATLTPPVSEVNCNEVVLTATLTIEKAEQEIVFEPIPLKYLEDDPDFQLGATATSGLPIDYTYTYMTDNPPATVSSEGWVTLLTSGLVEITAHQEGNENYLPAIPVIQPLQINSRDASAHSIQIEGEVYPNPAPVIHYTLDCGDSQEGVTVLVEAETNAQVTPAREFFIPTPAPGFFTQQITITSQDGMHTETYTVKVERQFVFEDIVVQKFNNVLLVNNNPETNGGYKFVAYQWFKNNQPIGTGQYYSAGERATDVLDPYATYRVEMTTENGDVLQVCSFQIQLSDKVYSFKVYPNPVRNEQQIIVMADFPIEEIEKGINISLYSLTGQLLLQQRSNERESVIATNGLVSGSYLVICTSASYKSTFKIIVE